MLYQYSGWVRMEIFPNKYANKQTNMELNSIPGKTIDINEIRICLITDNK